MAGGDPTGSGALGGAAVAGLLPDEASCTALLKSIVDVARQAFGAAACSIALHDESAHALVFAAVAGEGAGVIEGQSFSAEAGIAGWVLTSEQAIAIDDVRRDPRFAADVAERTGFVPRTIMAAPLLHGERTLGVLSVLDRDPGSVPGLAALELLDALADQAAAAVDLAASVRRAREAAGGQDPERAAVARLAAVADTLEGARREDVLALLGALERVLTRR